MATETNGEGTSLQTSGFYKHKETGVVVPLNETPGVGSPLIDAYVRMGFEKVSEAEAMASTPASSKEDASGDVYSTNTTKNGNVQYRKNGKIIKKEVYDAR